MKEIKETVKWLHGETKSDLIAWQRETLYIGLMWQREMGPKKLNVDNFENLKQETEIGFFINFLSFPKPETYAKFLFLQKGTFYHKMNFRRR